MPAVHVPKKNTQRASGAGCKEGQSGKGKCPTLDTPYRSTCPPPPPGDLLPPLQRTTQAPNSVRCRLCKGPPHRHPPCPRKTGSGPRPHGSRTGERQRECPTPDKPHRGTERPPMGTLRRSKSVQRQLPSACAVGLVNDPHASISCFQGKLATGPGRASQGRAAGAGRMPNPRRTSQKQEAPPPSGALLPPRQHATPAFKSVRCRVDDGPPHQQSPDAKKKGSRPRPHAPRMGSWETESAHTRTSLTEARNAPLGAPSCCTHRAHHQSLRSRVGEGPPPTHPRAQGNPAGAPNRKPQGQAVGVKGVPGRRNH